MWGTARQAANLQHVWCDGSCSPPLRMPYRYCVWCADNCARVRVIVCISMCPCGTIVSEREVLEGLTVEAWRDCPL